jgi:uncharacterized membrane protein HdeD (DUF308 family)
MAAILPHVSDHWWVLALRGVAAILFAILAFLWPGLTLAILVVIFGAFALIDGIAALATGVRARLWPLALFGVLGVIVGLYALFIPGLTALALVIVIGAWAIVRGVFELIAAVRLRREITNEWFLALSGVVSLLFGVALMLFPGAGALSLVWLIAVSALLIGVLYLALAFRMRSGHRLVGAF